MTHDLALYMIDALIDMYGPACPLGPALRDTVTISQVHKDGLLKAFGAEMSLGNIKARLTPPTTREEILDKGCLNCGSNETEMVKVDVNMQEKEGVICHDCGHVTILPDLPEDTDPIDPETGPAAPPGV